MSSSELITNMQSHTVVKSEPASNQLHIGFKRSAGRKTEKDTMSSRTADSEKRATEAGDEERDYAEGGLVVKMEPPADSQSCSGSDMDREEEDVKMHGAFSAVLDRKGEGPSSRSRNWGDYSTKHALPSLTDGCGSPFCPQKQTRQCRPYVCSVCEAAFDRPSRLRRHLLVHSRKKAFPCEECAATFPRRSELKRHLVVHTGKKPVSCKECEATFDWPCHLKRHMMVHTGEKSFICKECGDNFALACHLKSHMRTHTGEKPFACEECGASFRESSHKKRHMRIHTGEKPFSCSECEATFRQLDHLKKHEASHKRKNFLMGLLT